MHIEKPTSPDSFALTPMGHEMRKHFLFHPDVINLNHGSFGTYPRQVQTRLRAAQDSAEAFPDKYIRYDFPVALDKSRAAIADYLQVPMSSCVLIENATTGVNLVLRNLVYKPEEVIVYFDTIYGACEKTILSVGETMGVKNRKVQYELGVDSHDDIVAAFEKTVKELEAEGLKAKVAVFDTIVSMPGLRFPFEKLTKKAKELNVLSCIDGAHAVGQIKLDLAGLDPDFFVSNCHKWLYTPRGCAVFYVPERNQSLIRTSMPTSHGYVPASDVIVSNPLGPGKKSPFVLLFEFVATVDNSPYTTIPTALKFREEVCGGDDKVITYMHEIVNKGAEYAASLLGTEVLSSDTTKGAEDEMRQCALATVRLPLDYAKLGEKDLYTVSQWLHTMALEFNTFIPVVKYRDQLWARFAGQIYLDMDDFKFGAQLLKKLCEGIDAGAMDEAKFDVTDLKAQLGKI